MFGFYSWSYLADAVSRVPKEVTFAGLAYLAISDITKRNAQVKIEVAKAETRAAELEVEALKLKLELQKNDPSIETP